MKILDQMIFSQLLGQYIFFSLQFGNRKFEKKPIAPQSLMDVSPLRVLVDTLDDDVKTACPFCS